MGRLNFRKKINLAGISDGWTEEHYIETNNFKFKDLAKLNKLGLKENDTSSITEENMQGIVDVLKEKFVGGKVLVDGETVDATAQDYDDLPPDTITDILNAAMGKLDPKASKNLNG